MSARGESKPEMLSSGLTRPENSDREVSKPGEPKQEVSGQEADVAALREKLRTTEREVELLLAEGLDEKELDSHVRMLHEYNEVKDTAQMLIGRIAQLEGVTTRQMYPQFGLDLDD